MAALDILTGVGSSPLMRGKRAGVERAKRDHGLIPTHAGKTSWARLASSSGTAHPHSRGENIAVTIAPIGFMGSSPLTRGKRTDRRRRRSQQRLIPTHAGKTTLTSRLEMLCRAHPHSRGENIKAAAAAVAEWGSSPLTRGKPHRHRVQRHEGGLIPTHAGKT